jgi:hypothetical protein
MEAKLFDLGASILLAPAPFGSALRTARWPVGEFEEGALRFSKDRAPQGRLSVAGGTKLEGQEADDRFQ